MRYSLLVLFAFGVFAGNPVLKAQTGVHPEDLEVFYRKAVEDAMTPDSSEVCDTLWDITQENSRLLRTSKGARSLVRMACFTRFPDTYSDSTVISGWGILWVFVPQQFRIRMTLVLHASSDTLMRVKQMLGLPPENRNYCFAEFDVDPADLFRPSADREITDRICSLYLSPDADSLHRIWFLENIYASYFSEYRHYPWTRLGYTFDWAPGAPETGLSEYCVRKGAVLTNVKLYNAAEFLRKQP